MTSSHSSCKLVTRGANGMQLCVVHCIVYIVDAEKNECLLVGMTSGREAKADTNES